MDARCDADEPVTWFTDMFPIIQCLSKELSYSLRLDGVDDSLKAELLVWRETHLHTRGDACTRPRS